MADQASRCCRPAEQAGARQYKCMLPIEWKSRWTGVRDYRTCPACTPARLHAQAGNTVGPDINPTLIGFAACHFCFLTLATRIRLKTRQAICTCRLYWLHAVRWHPLRTSLLESAHAQLQNADVARDAAAEAPRNTVALAVAGYVQVGSGGFVAVTLLQGWCDVHGPEHRTWRRGGHVASAQRPYLNASMEGRLASTRGQRLPL